MTTNIHLETMKIRELSDEYKRRGYKVQLEPKLVGLRWRPDLVAKKGKETIIVEVVSKRSLSHDKLAEFARYAENRENARFDLVVTNPKLKRAEQRKEVVQDKVVAKMRRRMLQDARLLDKTGNYQAAFILIYSVMEGLIRETLARRGTMEPAMTLKTREVANILLKDGFISKSNWNLITKMTSIRNRLVHGKFHIKRDTLIHFMEFVSNLQQYV